MLLIFQIALGLVLGVVLLGLALRYLFWVIAALVVMAIVGVFGIAYLLLDTEYYKVGMGIFIVGAYAVGETIYDSITHPPGWWRKDQAD